jgi:ATP-dependent Zn protease
MRGRKEILEFYLGDKPVADDVNPETLARGTPGFSGADLFNLVNVAAIQAAIHDTDKINTAMMEYAKDRIMVCHY